MNSKHDITTLILAFFWIFLASIAGAALCIIFGPIGLILAFFILIVILVATIIIES